MYVHKQDDRDAADGWTHQPTAESHFICVIILVVTSVTCSKKKNTVTIKTFDHFAYDNLYHQCC